MCSTCNNFSPASNVCIKCVNFSVMNKFDCCEHWSKSEIDLFTKDEIDEILTAVGKKRQNDIKS